MTTFGVDIDSLMRSARILRDEIIALRKGLAASNADRYRLRTECENLRAERDSLQLSLNAALDCHPADGVSFCGACLSCWARVHDEVVRERDAAIGHVTTWEPIVRAAQALQVVYDDRQSMAVQQDCMIDLIDRVRRTLE